MIRKAFSLFCPANLAVSLLVLLTIGIPVCCLGQDHLTDSPMSLSGFSPSQSYEVEDFQQIEPDDEFLVRLLYRIAKVSRTSLSGFEEYSKEIPLSRVKEDPRKFRFWVRTVSGNVKQIKKHRLAEPGDNAGLKGYFEVDLATASGAAKIFARSIPDRWLLASKGADPSGQPVSITGFFFKLLGESDGDSADEPIAVYVANRLRWFPEETNEELGVMASHVILAKAGVDISGFDIVRKQNTKFLNEKDAWCFYQMLASTLKIERQGMPGDAVGFVELVRNPKNHFGDAVSLSGRVRRCVPIEIESIEVQKATGLSRYYELDMFYLLGDRRIIINSEGGKKLEYQHRFPVTVCVAQLPAGVSPADMEDHIVRVDGFFFRFWKYQSEFTGQDGAQVSPLVIGLVPEILEQSAGLLDNILMYLLLAILAGALIMFWIYQRSDKNSPIGNSTANLPEKIEIGEFEVD